MQLTIQTERSLIATLEATPRSDPHYQYHWDNVSRVLAAEKPQFEDVPMALRRLGDPKYSKAASSLPFSSRFTPVPTIRLARATQGKHTTYQPNSFEDILEPGAITAIQQWLYVEGNNMDAISKYDPGVMRVKDAKVLPQRLLSMPL